MEEKDKVIIEEGFKEPFSDFEEPKLEIKGNATDLTNQLPLPFSF